MQLSITLWFGLIAFLSFAPGAKQFLGTAGSLHNVGHFFVFAASGVMLLAFAAPRPSRVRRILFLLLFCVGIEALQSVIYRNVRFEWRDLVVDYFAIGASLVVLYAWPLLMGRESLRKPVEEKLEKRNA